MLQAGADAWLPRAAETLHRTLCNEFLAGSHLGNRTYYHNICFAAVDLEHFPSLGGNTFEMGLLDPF